MINKTESEIKKRWNNLEVPVVSVTCTAFNHGKFITKCLDSILEQETDFPFEIIVHDDASTDNTAQIITQYYEKYPTIIVPILEKENQYSKKDGSIRRIIREKTRGSYIARCECDDQWTTNQKLQKQYDYMQSNDNCILCVHNTIKHNLVDGNDTLFFSRPEPVFKLQEEEVFFGWNVHTSSYFYRVELEDYRAEFPDVWCGDYAMLICAFAKGEVVAINCVMSQYNYNNKDGITWKNIRMMKEKGIDQDQARIDFLKQYDILTENRFSAIVQKRIELTTEEINLNRRMSIDTREKYRAYRDSTRNSDWYSGYCRRLSAKRRMKELGIMNSYSLFKVYKHFKIKKLSAIYSVFREPPKEKKSKGKA